MYIPYSKYFNWASRNIENACYRKLHVVATNRSFLLLLFSNSLSLIPHGHSPAQTTKTPPSGDSSAVITAAGRCHPCSGFHCLRLDVSFLSGGVRKVWWGKGGALFGFAGSGVVRVGGRGWAGIGGGKQRWWACWGWKG